MVRTYEVTFIAAPTLSKEEVENYTQQMKGVAEAKNGQVVNISDWGKRKLAYRIKKFGEAYYVVLTLKGDGAAIAELERRFKVTDFIIRFLSVRIDEDLKHQEKMKEDRARKRAHKKGIPAESPQPEKGAAQVAGA
ncbi:MAG: 30S ribosomal protein S6 [Acidobacteria bacterium]|nr:30S ribosomal protein S6 [Acidobacteriota bacterium]